MGSTGQGDSPKEMKTLTEKSVDTALGEEIFPLKEFLLAKRYIAPLHVDLNICTIE